MKIPTPFILAIFAGLLAATAAADAKRFEVDNGQNKYRNIATFESVADFETFTGKTNGVSGAIFFDPVTRKGGGRIVVDAGSIDTGIPARNGHMRSGGFLNTAQFPDIVFEAVKVQPLRHDDFKVTGRFTLHGVTHDISPIVRLKYHPEDDVTRKNGFKGDVVQLNTSFNISLEDYGIKVDPSAAGKIAKEVTISLSCYAVTK